MYQLDEKERKQFQSWLAMNEWMWTTTSERNISQPTLLYWPFEPDNWKTQFFGVFLWFHTTNQECIFVVIKQKTLQIEKGFFGKEIDQLCY